MSSNNYNLYNYPNYPHSNAPNYSLYSTAATTNNPPPARPYQQPPVATTQPEYASYNNVAYNAPASSFRGGQNNSWTGSRYSGSRETTRGAAEVLRNMSNTAYSSNASRGNQHHDYSNRQLPSVGASLSNQPSPITTSISYPSQHVTAPIAQHSTPETYNQPTAVNTVDPMAVYDPWPEYQRQQEARKAQKDAEDAAQAEVERKAKEAEDAARAEAERKFEDARREEERKAEEEEKAEEKRIQMAEETRSKEAANQSSTSNDTGASPDLEAEIRAMMAKMRELNGRDPALLAKIWEEERRAKAPSQRKPTPQAPAVDITQSIPPAELIEKSIPTPVTVVQSISQSKPSATPRPVDTTERPVTVALQTPQLGAQISHRPTGHTIWPQTKREELGRAATSYLNELNPNNTISSDQILNILNINPSYIELCEILEGMALALDRAVFAKKLLAAVPDINSTPRSQDQGQVGAHQSITQVKPTVVQRSHVPPALLTTAVGVAPMTSPAASQTPQPVSHFTPIHNGDGSMSQSPIAVAEMVPIKMESKPVNKEKAARKRTFGDLIDLTLMDEEDDEPVFKKPKKGNFPSASPAPSFDTMSMGIDGAQGPSDHFSSSNLPANNFSATDFASNYQPANNHPAPASLLSAPAPQASLQSRFSNMEEPKLRNVVQSLDKSKALRRNSYNPATIARDVLLACGRHPERQLNSHLDILRGQGSFQVPQDADLSTLRWDLIDPGRPPKGYFKNSVQELAEDTDEEYESAGDNKPKPPQALGTGTPQALLPEPTNPFKLKRRGRPPRQSLPAYSQAEDSMSQTPQQYRATPAKMSASEPRPKAAGVGYTAFRSVSEVSPDGNPLPKKKGRPIGWRKAIHGSAAAHARAMEINQHTPTPPSSLRNEQIMGSKRAAIEISSRSTSAAAAPTFTSFRCLWYNCRAELHNLETLKKHVHKLHRKETVRGTLQCLWGECGREVTHFDTDSGMQIQRHTPFAFTDEQSWRHHIQTRHFDPLSWELGDGPAGGLSDATDSEDYLKDSRGRQVTPRIVAECANDSPKVTTNPQPRGRGRPPKSSHESEARDLMNRMVARKKKLGAPGIDRGGATFVNEKRRRGFSDDQVEEQFFNVDS